MVRGPKKKEKIVCPRCNRLSQPVRGYCRNCATVLLKNGLLEKVLVDDTPKELNSEQEQILTGLMLGDGCLYKNKETHTPYLCVNRKLEDKPYLIDNYEMFKNFCKKEIVEKSIFDKRTNKTYKSCKFSTRRCSVFEKYYSKWYNYGIKVIPKEILLTPLTLAIWFCDDGSVRKTCSPWRYRIKLSTDSFSEFDVNFLANLLSKIINSKVNVLKNKNGQFTIDMSNKSARLFLELIDPVFPESMTRKAYWRLPEARFKEGPPSRKFDRQRDEKGRFTKFSKYPSKVSEDGSYPN